MKIAYIITAYIDPRQLRRLISRLTISDKTKGEAHFYVHVDKKFSQQPFESLFNEKEKVWFAPNRYRINWGGFNQVRSQLELLRMVYESHISYDRVVCLSATDYPLVSNNDLIKVFEANADTEYIGGYNLTKSKDKAQLKKVCQYHFFRDAPLPLKLKRLVCYASRQLFTVLPIRKHPWVIGRNGKRYDVYTGSDYWALSGKCAKMVYETMIVDDKLMKYFEYSFIPSEGVINTIVFNSRYKDKCLIYNEDEMIPKLEDLTPLQHLQYGKAIKVYTLDDWGELKNCGKMFFRKARTGISDSLLDKLDKYADEE